MSACIVLPIEDSIDGIFKTLWDAAKIMQAGGGVGYAFSRLSQKALSLRVVVENPLDLCLLCTFTMSW